MDSIQLSNSPPISQEVPSTAIKEGFIWTDEEQPQIYGVRAFPKGQLPEDSILTYSYFVQQLKVLQGNLYPELNYHPIPSGFEHVANESIMSVLLEMHKAGFIEITSVPLNGNPMPVKVLYNSPNLVRVIPTIPQVERPPLLPLFMEERSPFPPSLVFTHTIEDNGQHESSSSSSENSSPTNTECPNAPYSPDPYDTEGFFNTIFSTENIYLSPTPLPIHRFPPSPSEPEIVEEVFSTSFPHPLYPEITIFRGSCAHDTETIERYTYNIMTQVLEPVESGPSLLVFDNSFSYEKNGVKCYSSLYFPHHLNPPSTQRFKLVDNDLILV